MWGRGCQSLPSGKPALAYSKCKIKVATTVILTPREGQVIRLVESRCLKRGLVLTQCTSQGKCHQPGAPQLTLIISRTLRAPDSPEVSALGSGLQAALQDLLEPTSSAESVGPEGGSPRGTSSRPLACPAKALSAGKETTQLPSHPHPCLPLP